MNVVKKQKFVEGEIYHICNKSIANFGIFRDVDDGLRFLNILEYYNSTSRKISYSDYLNINGNYQYRNILIEGERPFVKFLAYCIMPDHYHILVKIYIRYFSSYISRIENSFTRYFNLKFGRKGPLWQSRFRSIRITTNEQLLHVHRYIHLNPTSSNLVKKPEEWLLSSYKNFIEEPQVLQKMIREISISNRLQYKKFVEDQKDHQRRLKQIKGLILE